MPSWAKSFTDRFARAGALAGSVVDNLDGGAGVKTWSNLVGGYLTASGKATGTADDAFNIVELADAGALTDFAVEFVIAAPWSASAHHFASGRGGGAGTNGRGAGYVAGIDGSGGASISDINTLTGLAAASVGPFVVGDVGRVEFIGNHIEIFRNGLSVLEYTDGANLHPNGVPGLYAFDNVAAFSHFAVYGYLGASVPIYSYVGNPLTFVVGAPMSITPVKDPTSAKATGASVTSGTLPPGLAPSGVGVISGTPTTPGVYDFEVTFTNGSGAGVAYAMRITITTPAIVYPDMLFAMGQAGIVVVPGVYGSPEEVGTFDFQTGSPVPPGMLIDPPTGLIYFVDGTVSPAVQPGPQALFDDDVTVETSEGLTCTFHVVCNWDGTYPKPRVATLETAEMISAGNQLRLTFSLPDADNGDTEAWDEDSFNVTPETATTAIPIVPPGDGFGVVTEPDAFGAGRGSLKHCGAGFDDVPGRMLNLVGPTYIGLIADHLNKIDYVKVGVNVSDPDPATWTTVPHTWNPESKWFEYVAGVSAADLITAGWGGQLVKISAVAYSRTAGKPRLIEIDVFVPDGNPYPVVYRSPAGDDGTAVQGDRTKPALSYKAAMNIGAAFNDAAGRGKVFDGLQILYESGDYCMGVPDGDPLGYNAGVSNVNVTHVTHDAAPGVDVDTIRFNQRSRRDCFRTHVKIHCHIPNNDSGLFGFFLAACSDGLSAPELWTSCKRTMEEIFKATGTRVNSDSYWLEGGNGPWYRTGDYVDNATFGEFCALSRHETIDRMLGDALSDSAVIVNCTLKRFMRAFSGAHQDWYQFFAASPPGPYSERDNICVDGVRLHPTEGVMGSQGVFGGSGFILSGSFFRGCRLDNRFSSAIYLSAQPLFRLDGTIVGSVFRGNRWVGTALWGTNGGIWGADEVNVVNNRYPFSGTLDNKMDTQEGALGDVVYSTEDADGPGPVITKPDGSLVACTFNSVGFVDGKPVMLFDTAETIEPDIPIYVSVPDRMGMDAAPHFTPFVSEQWVSNGVTTTIAPTTAVPTTEAPTTPEPTTGVPTTPGPTTTPTTGVPTTPGPTTVPPTTTIDTGKAIACGRMFRSRLRQCVVRAWTQNRDGIVDEAVVMAPLLCSAQLIDEERVVAIVVGEVDPAGAHVVRFVLPDIAPRAAEAFVLRVHMVRAGAVSLGVRDFFCGTS